MQDSRRFEQIEVNPGGIGQRVATARARKGWNREALAYHAGLSWAAITQIENGRRKHLRQGTLVALAESLGVSTDYLISGRSPMLPMLDHRALLYHGPEEFASAVAPFLTDGLKGGQPGLVVTSKPNLRRLRRELGDASAQIALRDNAAWYRTPMVALGRYQSFIDDALDAGAPWLRVVGEPLWTGRPASEIRRWAEYESLLNLAFAAVPVTLICPYDVQALSEDILTRARITHPATHEDQSRRESQPYVDPAQFILEPVAGPPQ
jgi:transcriptional regulator with XRE-family HTH domain